MNHSPRQHLVLLHGWGADQRSWQPLLEMLEARYFCRVLSLPGYDGEAPCANVDDYLNELATRLPSRFVLLGWSLGGMLATRLATLYPQRVIALVTLASNACFVSREGWREAMADTTFTQFREQFAVAPQRTLKRFVSLVVSGDEREARLLRPLRDISLSSLQRSCGNWSEGLEWLQQLDNRESFTRLRIPGLHLLAAEDALVPAGAAGDLRTLNPGQEVTVVESCGHALHWSFPGHIAGRITAFLDNCSYRIVKRDIAESFSRAAPTYDSVAGLQRRVGERLLSQIDGRRCGACLDLGSGTGYFVPQLARQSEWLIGLDLALGMLRYARARAAGEPDWICGDAEQLPLGNASIDTVFSSMTIQWCSDAHRLFRELHRVMRPGARAYLATLGPATLGELRSAWSRVDGYTHVNQFAEVGELLSAAGRAGLDVVTTHTENLVLEFDRVGELTSELKSLGAHNMNRGRNSGLSGRRRLQAFRDAYERYRNAAGKLPATYEVIYLEFTA